MVSKGSRELDERFLRRALALAELGKGTTAPNPLVGAVVAKGERLLGQGFHRRPGEPHAEALALRAAEATTRSGARGATLYTNLEPCCHTGRTPPCVDAILEAGVARVVASIADPNPRVNGGGFRALRRRGVDVSVGLLRDEALRLNEGFLKLTRVGLPFVTLKGASSLDGRIATKTGSSKWITSASARRHARLLRAENEAVLVGIETVLADDPRLDRRPRIPGAVPLLRAVADGRLRIPLGSRLVSTPSEGPLVVFTSSAAPRSRRRALAAEGVEVVELPERPRESDGRARLDLRSLLEALGARGVSRLLVEGGGELHAGFLEAGLADRLVLYVAPKLLGGRGSRSLVGGQGAPSVAEALSIRDARCARIGDGWMLLGALSRARSRR